MPQLNNVSAVMRCEEPSEFILAAQLGGVCGWSTHGSIMACIAAMVEHKKEMH